MESWKAGCKKIVFHADRSGRVPPLWINAHTKSIFIMNSAPSVSVYLTIKPFHRTCSFCMQVQNEYKREIEGLNFTHLYLLR